MGDAADFIQDYGTNGCVYFDDCDDGFDVDAIHYQSGQLRDHPTMSDVYIWTGIIKEFTMSGSAKVVTLGGNINVSGATIYHHIMSGWNIGDEVEIHIKKSNYKYFTLLSGSHKL